MTMTITTPDRLARRLQEQASIRRRSAEDIALDITHREVEFRDNR